MKKIYLIILLIILGVSITNLGLAQKGLEVQLPILPSGEQINYSTSLLHYVRYLFNFGFFLGVILAISSLIWAGIIYVFSIGRPEMKMKAKDRIWGGISGLILLLTCYLIIAAINPDLLFLQLTKLQETPGLYVIGTEKGETIKRVIGLGGITNVNKINPPFTKIEYKCNNGPDLIVSFYKQPGMKELFKKEDLQCGQIIGIKGQSFNFQFKKAGIYLYTNSNCEIGDPPPVYYSASKPDLEDLKNRVKSVKIVHNNPDYYFGFLYDFINYQGSCYILNPNTSCDNLSEGSKENNFVKKGASITVYKYSFSTEGDVTFYRNGNFDKTGGYLTIKSEDIQKQLSQNGLYIGNLKDLYFVDENEKCTVPYIERDCEEWDPKIEGKCLKRVCPTLAGEGCSQWQGDSCKKGKSRDSSGPNISSMSIDGNYFVLFIYFDPKKDNQRGPWTYCQGFPTIEDVNKKGPALLKWEDIQRTGRSPNYVIIVPVMEK